MTGSRRVRLATRLVIPLVGVGLLASACTSASSGGSGGAPASTTGSASDVANTAPATSTQTTSSAPPAPVELSMTPTRIHHVNPAVPITVTAKNGTLSAVKLVNQDGKVVSGALSSDKASWHATEALGYSRTYKMSATATDSSGDSRKTLTRSFTTLTPDNMTMPYLNTIYGSPIKNGAKYGVAMVASVSFDEPITNKKAAEKALVVQTSPHVDGAWTWLNDSIVHWRPKQYYAPGTKVTISANVYGVNVGGGMYGQSDKKVSFVIGRQQITVAKDTAPDAVNKVRVWRDGKVVRIMNTSMGKHEGVYANGQYISYYTMDGAYTVLGFENPAKMCSASYGLPANAPGGYPCENIYWSTKISTDGIYLHELDNTVGAQDSGQDVSHGCLNLNYDNAHWFFTHSLVGDPVVIHGTKGAPKITLSQGGDWSMTWKQWLAGSALH